MTPWTCPWCFRVDTLAEHVCPQFNALLRAFQVAAAPAAAAEGSVPGSRPAVRHLSAVRDCAPSANSKDAP